jgi:hypothetical protein
MGLIEEVPAKRPRVPDGMAAAMVAIAATEAPAKK